MAKIGVMGCGVVASYGHVPAILQTPGLELVSLYDPDVKHLHALGTQAGVTKLFTDQEAFFASGLDAVVVASPAWAHKENVLNAAKHGFDVLCEKPIAMNDEEAEEMIEAMAAAKKNLFVGFVYRFSPVAQQIKRWVEEKIVGDVRSLRLVYLWNLHGQFEQTPDSKWVESPRWRGRMLEGGPMVDCGVHQIDLARWWLQDEVASYDAHGAWVADYAAPDHVYLHMDHESGCHTMVEMSFTYGHTERDPRSVFTYELIGTGGVVRYDRDGWALEARNGERIVTAPGASEKNFASMYSAFSTALKAGDPGDFPTGRDALIATKIARTATEQAMAKRRVTVLK